MNLIYSFILLLSSSPFIICFVSFGYLNINPQVFKNIQALILLSIMINIILKEFFQMQPLPGHVGWSFPSGHSHVFSVMCVGLFIFFRSRLIFLLSIIFMCLLPFALSNYNHHYYSDSLAAYVYSIGTLGIFFTTRKIIYDIENNLLIYFLSILLIVLSFFVYLALGQASFISTSITLLIFLYCSNYFYINKESLLKLNFHQRIIINICALTGLGLIYFINNAFSSSHIAKHIINYSTYSLCAVLISFIIPKYLIISKTAK